MSRKRVFKIFLSLGLLVVSVQDLVHAGSSDLVVYSYDSFAAKGGLGAEVIPLFEAKCGCKVKLISVGSAGQLVTRIELDHKRGVSTAHVALGLDANTFTQLNEFILPWGKWRPRNFKNLLADAKLGVDFLPLEFGYFAWIVDRETFKKTQGLQAKFPKNLKDLLHPALRRSLLLQDPRISTPGLSFLLYTDAVLRAGVGDYWKNFRSQWLTLTPSWSAAYGLFLKGEAPLVWSYTTSQAFHEENGAPDRFQAILFEEGQPIQVEGAVFLKGVDKDSLTFKQAREFLEFLISDEVQARVPLKNWMFPVVKNTRLPKSFQNLPHPQKTIHLRPSHEKISSLLHDWSTWVQGIK